MKKILSLCASLMLAVNCFATGNEGVNPPQSGVISPSSATPNITNTFAFPFQTVPVVLIYCNATNGTPITNGVITTTNFAFSFPAIGTNDLYSWQAYVGGTRVESGTQVLIGTLSTNVTFPFPYATVPVVTVSGNNTNVASSVIAITTTNFTINSPGNTTNQWISVGTVYNPASENTGQFPRNNTIVY